MSSSGPNPGDIFDVKRIRRLVELMNEHELSEIDLRQADLRIRLRKGSDPVFVSGPAAIGGQVRQPASNSDAGAAPSPAKVEQDNLTVIKSPMVGTFYAALSPDSPPCVKVGDHVGPQSTVCVIEAMKVFNEIPAEISGQIAAVLVENGEPVEFGQPLFKVDTRK